MWVRPWASRSPGRGAVGDLRAAADRSSSGLARAAGRPPASSPPVAAAGAPCLTGGGSGGASTMRSSGGTSAKPSAPGASGAGRAGSSTMGHSSLVSPALAVSRRAGSQYRRSRGRPPPGHVISQPAGPNVTVQPLSAIAETERSHGRVKCWFGRGKVHVCLWSLAMSNKGSLGGKALSLGQVLQLHIHTLTTTTKVGPGRTTDISHIIGQHMTWHV